MSVNKYKTLNQNYLNISEVLSSHFHSYKYLALY